MSPTFAQIERNEDGENGFFYFAARHRMKITTTFLFQNRRKKKKKKEKRRKEKKKRKRRENDVAGGIREKTGGSREGMHKQASRKGEEKGMIIKPKGRMGRNHPPTGCLYEQGRERFFSLSTRGFINPQ